VEASIFALAVCALLVLLGLVSMPASWELAGVAGWIWFLLAVPELLLVGARPRRWPAGAREARTETTRLLVPSGRQRPPGAHRLAPAARGLRVRGAHERHRLQPHGRNAADSPAKTLMSLDALISVGAVLLVAARAVNVLGG